MSFDLGVWYSYHPLTFDQAGTIYGQLCHSDLSALTIDSNTSRHIAAFMDDITRKYPSIEDLPEEELDDCPWSVDFDRSDVHAILPMAWSRVEEVAPFVKNLAYKHGLVCYDPQEDRVYLPPSLQSSASNGRG
jgi:hypothetical protein